MSDLILLASTSIAGKHGGLEKDNQDRHMEVKRFMKDPELVLLTVMDGHGSNGAEASDYVKYNFPQVLAQEFDANSDLELKQHILESFKTCFKKANINLKA